MDLRLTITAVQSLQSFTPDIEDEVIIYGRVLGAAVTITSPSGELLQRLDEVLSGIHPSNSPPSAEGNFPQDDVDYELGSDYAVGGLGDD